MKTKIYIFLLVTFAATGVFAQQTPKTVTDTVSIKGMSCVMCERRIEKGIKKMSGIRSIEADSDNETAVVAFDPAVTSKDAIERAISKIGYDAGSYAADKEAREHLPGCCNPNAQH